MNLFYLTPKDFNMAHNPTLRCNIMCTRVPHISVVLFYTERCAICVQLLPIFKYMPNMVRGCQFGLVSLDQHRQLYQASQNTNTPITHVPTIILYNNGVPFASYKGRLDVNDLRDFIIAQARYIEQQSSFQDARATNAHQYYQQMGQQQNMVYNDTNRLPTWGVPLSGELEDQYMHISLLNIS